MIREKVSPHALEICRCISSTCGALENCSPLDKNPFCFKGWANAYCLWGNCEYYGSINPL